MEGICPYALGMDPGSLDCKLAWDADRGRGFWRRLWHGIRGDYCCMTYGTLPCPVLANYNKRKQEGK